MKIEITDVCLKKVDGYAEVWVTLEDGLDVLVIKEHCDSNFYNKVTADGIISICDGPREGVRGYIEDVIFGQDPIHEEIVDEMIYEEDEK